jgi:hypothetical protein
MPRLGWEAFKNLLCGLFDRSAIAEIRPSGRDDNNQPYLTGDRFTIELDEDSQHRYAPVAQAHGLPGPGGCPSGRAACACRGGAGVTMLTGTPICRCYPCTRSQSRSHDLRETLEPTRYGSKRSFMSGKRRWRHSSLELQRQHLPLDEIHRSSA